MCHLLPALQADLRHAYVAHGLDLVELRAVFAALPAEFANDPTGEKNAWREELRAKAGTTERRKGGV